MDVRVNWKDGLAFTGTADSGFEVPLGANPDIAGSNEGFRPIELMALSLAGCTSMDVISILQKKRQDVTGFEVKVHSERADEHPKVITSAEINYHVVGHGIEEKALVRAIELSAVRYCPAQGMLSQIIPITLSYFIYEARETGEAELVLQGTYQVPDTEPEN